jgi:hypothetical protein
MGQKIPTTHFTPQDVARFTTRLHAEAQLARETFANQGFASDRTVAGFELEAWLLDRNFYPIPCNQSFLARMADPEVVAELSRFNIELNGTPHPLTGAALSTMESQLNDTWARCVRIAHGDEATAIAIGTLPTLREADLNLSTMTPSKRYRALNQQVFKARNGRPLTLDIDAAPGCGEPLRTAHTDVMLEAATTSFQLHLQVPAEQIGAHLNASMILSGPLVALSANSPFLFGHTLWHETRVPLFEQAVDGSEHTTLDGRASFGPGYLGSDPSTYFIENAARFPVLLPICDDTPPEAFEHLRLHNGTVWRWNRLLIGFDEARAPHLRIEQRVMPAGPSVIDMIANAAFYYGAVHMLAQEPDLTARLPFTAARGNFYRAARHGLDARLRWLDGQEHDAAELLLALLPRAREGLRAMRIECADVDRYMDVLAVRLRMRCNGAVWQRAHHAKHGDLFKLTADYLEHQRSGMPVHEWPL